jgi:biotin-(acetyl-CoA carboxylase) ligase
MHNAKLAGILTEYNCANVSKDIVFGMDRVV